MAPITSPPDPWQMIERGEHRSVKRSPSTLSLSAWISDSDSSKCSADRLLCCGCFFVALGVMDIITAWAWNRRGVLGLGAGMAGVFVGACQLWLGLEQHAQGGGWYGSNSRKWKVDNSTRRHITTLAAATLAAYLLSMLLIHGLTPDQFFHVFPEQCPPDKKLGCARIAELNSHRSLGASPLRLHASLEDVHAMVQAWVQQQPGGVVLNDLISTSPSRPDSFVHARFASAVWGFADDVFISARCDKNVAVLEIQGQLRLGIGDMDVNGKRNLQFLSHVQGQVANKLLPVGECRAPASKAPDRISHFW